MKNAADPADSVPDRLHGADEVVERWKKENRAAIEAYNEWLDEHGLPLGEFRQF